MFWFVQIRFIQRKKFKTNILQGYSSLSNIFFLRRTHSKIVILTLLRALKVDMLTIQKLYGLNITSMSKAIWEYKNELPSLHELARSLSEKGTDFHRMLSPEGMVQKLPWSMDFVSRIQLSETTKENHFMGMISLEGKTNFFEKRAGEYQRKMFFHSIAISKYF